MKSYKVSFCIPVYNIEAAASKLVTDLLDNKSDRFQVVVSDDASTDGTVDRLNVISDPRFKLCVNTNNVGAKLNWCQALEQGDGEWLYFVIGRDKLNAGRINYLLDLLDKLDEEKIGCVYDRPTNTGGGALQKEVVLDQYDSVTYFLKAGEHPTGAIFNRKAFWEIEDRKKYFMMEFAYPEIYIKRDILVRFCGAVLDAGVFTREVNVDKSIVKSNFERNKKVLFYYPSKRTEQFLHVIKMVEFERKFSFCDSEFDDFFIIRYRELLRSVSTMWKLNNMDSEWTSHYSREVRTVTRREQISNIVTALRTVNIAYGERFSIKRKMCMLLLNMREIVRVLVVG